MVDVTSNAKNKEEANEKLGSSSALKSSPQAAFDCSHFPVVGFVVISHKMQQSVNDQTMNIGLKSKRSCFTNLIICGLR